MQVLTRRFCLLLSSSASMRMLTCMEVSPRNPPRLERHHFADLDGRDEIHLVHDGRAQAVPA